MNAAEAETIARALRHAGFPASVLNTSSGPAIYDDRTSRVYHDPWYMPLAWTAVYRDLLGPLGELIDELQAE